MCAICIQPVHAISMLLIEYIYASSEGGRVAGQEREITIVVTEMAVAVAAIDAPEPI